MKKKNPGDIVEAAIRDHRALKVLFAEFAGIFDEEKPEVAAEIVSTFAAHLKFEDEVLFPAIRNLLEDDARSVDGPGDERRKINELLAHIGALTSNAASGACQTKVAQLETLLTMHAERQEQCLSRFLRQVTPATPLGS